MIHKFNKILFHFYCWKFEYYNSKTKKYTHHFSWYIIYILTKLVVFILPYWFTQFTWYRILVYMVDYKYMPVSLIRINDAIDKNLKEFDLDINDVIDIFDFYEVDQLDQ